MLSPDDRGLAEREPALPEFRTLLDPDAFAAALAETFPRLGVRGATPRYLRYKPGTSCLAAYTAALNGESLELHALTAADPAKLRVRPRDRTASTGFGPGGCRIGERPIVVRAFPRDAKLKKLVALADPALRHRFLPAELAAGRLEQVGYKPERRFVGRLTAASGSYCVKLHAPNRFASAYQGATAFREARTLRLATLVHAHAGSGVIVQAWLPGRLLADAQAAPDWPETAAALVGEALAELHDQRAAIPTAPIGGAEALLENGDTLVHLIPAHGGPWRTHVATLVGALEELAEADGPIHGDFYAKQVLLDGSRVSILDCDQARWGDQAEDLGTFRAHLFRDVLRGRLASGRAERIWDAFREGYGRRGSDFDLRVQLFTAIGCFRLAQDPFRHREPGWSRGVEALMQLSMAAMAPILGVAPAAPWR
ncbi:MAG: phosphotransferase family protein [Gemmatimonadales bacterium]